MRFRFRDLLAEFWPLSMVLGVMAFGAVGLASWSDYVEGVIAEGRGVPVVLDAASPREQPLRIALLAGVAQQMRPTAYADPTSGFCVNNSATLVYVVDEAATGVTNGDGPYCNDATTCAHGATIPVAGRAWAWAVGAPVTLSCRFVDDGGGYASGAPKASAAPGVPVGTACLRVGGLAGCPMTGQIVGGGAGSPTAPEYSVGGFLNRGFGSTAGVPVVTMSGTNRWVFDSSQTTFLGLLYGGTSASPTYSFTGDSGTGIGRSTAGVLDIHAGGGAAKMTMSTTVLSSAVNVVPSTTSTRDIGSTVLAWKNMFITPDGGAGVGGVVNTHATTPLYVSSRSVEFRDSNALDSDPDWRLTTYTSVPTSFGLQLQAPKVTTLGHASGLLEVPQVVTTAPLAPNCTANNESGLAYVDDTDDALPASLCVCMATNSGRSTFDWQMVSDPTVACVGL